jgi:hypothetical protein
MDVSVGVTVPASKVAVRVSVPVVPFNTSAEPSVWTPAAKEPSKESLPVPPEKLLTPVVSDLFCTQNGVNTHLFYIYFDIRPDIDSITTIDHQ